MDRLDDLFSQGTVASARSGAPVVLAGRSRVWQVTQGQVDVFLVRVADGLPADALHLLFRAGPGELLFGVGPDEVPPAEWALVAMGAPGHALSRLHRDALVPLLGDTPQPALVAATERWLTQLAAPLQGRRPAEAVPLQADLKHEGGAAGHFKAADRLLWVTMEAGHGDLYGLAPVPVSPGGGTPFPVPAEAWLLVDAQARFSVLASGTVLASPAAFAALDASHDSVAAALTAMFVRQEAGDGERLRDRVRQESAYLQSAVRSLAGVLTPTAPADMAVRRGSSPVLAAFRRVAHSLGIAVTVPPPLPDGAPPTSAGDELGTLVEASRIRRRLVALKGEWWTNPVEPLLAFRQEGGVPLAILPGPGGYVVHEAGSSVQHQLTPQEAQQLQPFAYTFYRSFADLKVSLFEMMKFGSRGLYRDYLLVILMGTVVGLLGMVMPLATGMLFDSVIPAGDREQLGQLAGALLAGAVATAMFRFTQGFAMLRAEGRMDVSIQAAVWDRLLRLPAGFFRKYTAGDLAMRANGINAIRRALSGTTLHSLFSAVFSLFNLGLLFFYSVKLAFVALALVLSAVLFTVVINFLILREQRHLAEISGRLSGMVFQFLSAVGKLRATGAETRAFHQWAAQYARQQRHEYRAQLAQGALMTFNAMFSPVANLALFAMVAFFLADEKSFTTGQFLAFNAAFGGLMGAMLGATAALSTVMNIVPIYERAKPILQTEPEITSSKGHPGQLTGDIEVSQVRFGYTPDAPPVLADVSLHIRPGEFIAIVGPSGSGKSTLLRLLLGFESPQSGSIYYDGQDMAGLDLGHLRRQLGVVLQNGQLMGGDLYSNIVGSAASLSVDDAWVAAEQAGVAADIRDMPMGMHTVIGDGGGTLSGGQRQRVLIARAIVRRPRIIFFDEATSALDNRTQAMVSESLEKLQATRVVIAHRLSTVVNADRIIVLERGAIVQSGTYAELMDAPGLFRELAARQVA
jgi:ATP-binding cassette subfamily C protein